MITEISAFRIIINAEGGRRIFVVIDLETGHHQGGY